MLGNYHLFHILLSLDYCFSVSKKAKLNTHTHSTQKEDNKVQYKSHTHVCMYVWDRIQGWETYADRWTSTHFSITELEP